MSESVVVSHNVAQRRFEAVVDGLVCRADYVRKGDEMHIVHTAVPSALEGRGIASALVRAAFDHAAANELKIVPACSYVRVWARRHRELAHLLAG